MPKQPQDHKPKVEKITVKIGDREVPGQRVVVKGITLEIPDEALDDWELLEDIAALDEKQGHRLPSVLRRLVGDRYGEIIESLRSTETGRVSIEAGADFVKATMEALAPNS